MSSFVDLMSEWYVCANKYRETTCVGPFKTALEADDFYNKSETMKSMSDSMLVVVCTLNPFKKYTLHNEYKHSFSRKIKLYTEYCNKL